MKTGVELIAEERQRQIDEEEWTAEHDDIENDAGDLATVATCYASNAACELHPFMQHGLKFDELPMEWPWDTEWWKPKGPLRDLIRAGALIAAEIDRLQRKNGVSDDELDGRISAADR